MQSTTYTEVPFVTTKNNSYEIRFNNDTKIINDDHTIILTNDHSLALQYAFEFEKYKNIVIEQQLNFDFKDNHKIITTTLNSIQLDNEEKILLYQNKDTKQSNDNSGIYINYQLGNVITGIISETYNTTFKLNDKPIRIQWNITCNLAQITALFKGSIYVHVINDKLYVTHITFKPLSVLIKN